MISNVEKRWNSKFLNTKNIAYPAEYVIRIFKGDYPKLKLSKNSFLKKKICDISCGDGRNLVFLNNCGFNIYGTEITQTIVNNTKKNLSKFNIKPILKVGNNSTIDFKDNFFDYLLSWSAIYYMGETLDFDSHVNEHARVLKKNGYLVMSIPKLSFPYFKGTKKLNSEYCVIKNDNLKFRNGLTLRYFKNQSEIKKAFSKKFKNFIFGSVEDDCFGWNNNCHLVICQKK
jgi:ubiquinone/menaquinone biosynthesis C-methylase UbiE